MILLRHFALVLIMTSTTAQMTKFSCPVPCICSLDTLNVTCSHLNLKKPLLWIETSEIQILDYSYNQIRDLGVVQPYNIINLDLSFNLIENITKDTFQFLSQLQILDLQRNLLVNIHSEAFQNLTNLKHLNLHGNYLVIVPGHLFWPLINMQTLDLTSNKFQTFSIGIGGGGLVNLKVLQLSYNTLGHITEEMMEPYQNTSLEFLNLTETSITQLDPNAFKYLKNLRVLIADKLDFKIALNICQAVQYLNINILHLNEIQLGPRQNATHILQNLNSSTLTELEFSSNLITHFNKKKTNDDLEALTDNQFKLLPFTPNLRKLILTGEKLMFLNLDIFELLTQLEILNLAGNKINYIRQADKSKSLQNLRELDLSYNAIMNLGAFRITPPLPAIKIGMFELPNLIKFRLNNNKLQRVYKSCFRMSNLPFLHGKGIIREFITLEALDLANNNLEKLDKEFFDVLPHLHTLNLTNNHFGKYLSKGLFINHFNMLTKLEFLNLSFNNITHILPQQFQNQTNLRILDLSNNALKTLNSDFLRPMSKLNALYLQKNQIAIIDFTVLDFFEGISIVVFSHNPFQCDCQSLNFSNWLQMAHNVPDILPDYYTCKASNTPLLELTYEKVCTPFTMEAKKSLQQKNYFNLPLVLSLITVVPLCLIIGIGAFAYYYRWYLRYWYHKVHMHIKIFSGQQSSISSPSKDYDAFVSYSSKDYEWVCLILRPKLEENASFKLCIHDRDFKLGYQITDNIVDSIESSRKIMLVLSKNYIQSEWCKWEMEIARFQDNLILVFLEDIPKNCMPPTLRFLARSRTYIEWKSDSQAQKVFWERVIAALHNSSIS